MSIDGVKFWTANQNQDPRGTFTKFFQAQNDIGLNSFDLAEIFITKSVKGVIRGIHLQRGASSNFKILIVLKGQIFDVLVDLRENSKNRFEIEERFITANSNSILMIPPGVAHGFQSLAECELLYLTSSNWNFSEDTGINPLSININWPIEITEISERDLNLPKLTEWGS